MHDRAKVTAKKPETKKSKTPQARKGDFNNPISSPIDHILLLQRTIGNQAVQRLFKSGVIQAKLKIGQPGDKYEQEADRVADAVMRMPEPKVQRQIEPEEEKEETLQAKPLADQITPLVQRQVEEEEEEELLQVKVNTGETPEVTPDLESRINALRGGGQPLPKSMRAFFEPRFGHDFSRVRVHNNLEVAKMAKVLNARAFTTGRDIMFRAGQYAPETTKGKKLIAHELTHVVQQKSAWIQPKLFISESSDRYEKDAERIERSLIQQEKRIKPRQKDKELVQLQRGEEKEITPSPEEKKVIDELKKLGLDSSTIADLISNLGGPLGITNDILGLLAIFIERLGYASGMVTCAKCFIDLLKAPTLGITAVHEAMHVPTACKAAAYAITGYFFGGFSDKLPPSEVERIKKWVKPETRLPYAAEVWKDISYKTSQKTVGWSFEIQRENNVTAQEVKDVNRAMFKNNPKRMAKLLYLSLIEESGVKAVYVEMYKAVTCDFPD